MIRFLGHLAAMIAVCAMALYLAKPLVSTDDWSTIFQASHAQASNAQARASSSKDVTRAQAAEEWLSFMHAIGAF